MQNRQGVDFDRRAEARGINFKMLRFGEDAILSPNPIIHHLGVVVHGEHTNLLTDPEPFNTYLAKIPRCTLEDAIGCDLTVITPNSKWYLSNDGGDTWILLRQLGDIDRLSPVRYHITLVEKGV